MLGPMLCRGVSTASRGCIAGASSKEDTVFAKRVLGQWGWGGTSLIGTHMCAHMHPFGLQGGLSTLGAHLEATNAPPNPGQQSSKCQSCIVLFAKKSSSAALEEDQERSVTD